MLQNVPSFVIDLIRLSLWLVILLVAFALLERLFHARNQQIIRHDFMTDLGYYFINGLLPKIIIAPFGAMLALGFQSVTPESVRVWSAELPIFPRLALMMIVGEFGFYWGHRWMHEIPVLWRFHVIHHSAERMDWLVNSRAHPLDLVLPRLCGLVLLTATGLAQPLAERADWASVLFVLISAFWGFFIHANLRWRFGWLENVISTPAFHHWHHANDGAETLNKNYAAMIPWVDRLFGTYHLPASLPLRYGTDTAVPRGLSRQLLHPFVPRGRAVSTRGTD